MAPPAAATITRRRLLKGGGLLAAGVAGCTAPMTTPGSGADGPVTLSSADRDRAQAVGKRSRPAVVVLQPASAVTSGTAWFLEGDYLVTNAHVVEELGDELRAHTVDGESFPVGLVRGRDRPDLALLSTDVEPPAALSPGQSTTLEPDQPLIQIGHPRVGYWTIAFGRFKRRVRRGDRAWVLTDLPMMHGNSGSPLITLEGAVVGLTFGSVPKRGTGPRANPTPAPPTVYESYPRQALEYGGHIAIETVQEYLRKWTASGGTAA